MTQNNDAARPSLEEIAQCFFQLIGSLKGLDLDGFYKDSIKQSYLYARSLRQRHDHGDPCDDKRCPCFAAGYKARAEDRDAFFAAKRARRSDG